jgi:hypothetical protein
MGTSQPNNQPREEKSLLVFDMSCKVSILLTRLVLPWRYSLLTEQLGQSVGSQLRRNNETFISHLGEMAGTNLKSKQPQTIIYHFRNLLFKPALNMAKSSQLLKRSRWKLKGNGY